MVISQSFKVIMAIVFYTSVEKSDANAMPLYESCFFSISFWDLLACVLKHQHDIYPKAYISVLSATLLGTLRGLLTCKFNFLESFF